MTLHWTVTNLIELFFDLLELPWLEVRQVDLLLRHIGVLEIGSLLVIVMVVVNISDLTPGYESTL